MKLLFLIMDYMVLFANRCARYKLPKSYAYPKPWYEQQNHANVYDNKHTLRSTSHFIKVIVVSWSKFQIRVFISWWAIRVARKFLWMFYRVYGNQDTSLSIFNYNAILTILTNILMSETKSQLMFEILESNCLSLIYNFITGNWYDYIFS